MWSYAYGDLVAFSNGYLTKLSGDCKNSIHRQLNSQENQPNCHHQLQKIQIYA